MQLRSLSELRVPAPKPDKTYQITVYDKHFTFHGLKHLLGAADFHKSGDVLAGLAARSELEREAAREILSSLTLQEIYDTPLVDDDGRVDDVMNVSGHRISTTEVESALVSHHAVAEAAVVGANDALTGQAIVAFVILRGGVTPDKDLEKSLRDHVTKEIGAIAKPRQIMVVAELPKTRSGKIMRRLLRDVAENRTVGDATTLADPNVMKLISEGLKSEKKED